MPKNSSRFPWFVVLAIVVGAFGVIASIASTNYASASQAPVAIGTERPATALTQQVEIIDAANAGPWIIPDNHTEVVTIENASTRTLIHWNQRVGDTQRQRIFELVGVKLNYRSFTGRFTDTTPVRPGVVKAWERTGNQVTLVVDELHEPNEQDHKLLNVAQVFQQHLVEQRLAVFEAHSCPDAIYRVDDRLAPKGSYGYTVQLPEKRNDQGLPNYNLGVFCGDPAVEIWNLPIRPGDWVIARARGNLTITQPVKMKPQDLCHVLGRLRPQWSLPVADKDLAEHCAMYDARDQRTMAVLSRFGFEDKAVGLAGQQFFVIFTWSGQGRSPDLLFANKRWKDVSSANVLGDTYVPQLITKDIPAIAPTAEARPDAKIIPVRFGEPFFALPVEDMDGQDFPGWERYKAYRIIKGDDGSTRLQEYSRN